MRFTGMFVLTYGEQEVLLSYVEEIIIQKAYIEQRGDVNKDSKAKTRSTVKGKQVHYVVAHKLCNT